MKKNLSLSVVLILFLCLNANAQQNKPLNAGELQIALQKLDVLGSALFIAAHPDDENTSVLAYLSKGKKYRTAYLSVTRGDGGQNLIGPEKGAEVGIIRTQELLSARRTDGAEQYFTRAIDFGYSKSPEETLEIWGREDILADIVWVIRKFRPDVVITRFSPDSSSGHGHHTASGWLVKDAFRAAADPKKFPEQLKYVDTWQAKRLFWNSWRPNPQDAKTYLKVDIGAYNPLLGKSYSEMAAESRSMHKSQGFGATGRRGSRFDYFKFVDGEPAEKDLFDGIDTTWQRLPGGKKVGMIIDKVIKDFHPQYPSKSLSALLEAYKTMSQMEQTLWIRLKREELKRVIQSCAGLWMEAIATDFAASPGDEIQVNTTIINRSNIPFKLEKISFPELAPDSVLNVPLENNAPQAFRNSFFIPSDYPISQPFWLEAEPQAGKFSIKDQQLFGDAENPPSIHVKIGLSANSVALEYSIPLVFRWTDRVNGELYRPFEIRPKVTIKLEEKVSIFANHESKLIKVTVKSHSHNISGNIKLNGTDKWEVTPISIPFSLVEKYEEQQFEFRVSPPRVSDEALLTAEAEVDGEKFSRGLVEIAYPHIKRQWYFPESKIKVVKLDIKRLGRKLGYIMGAGDEVADGLRALGYEVILLDDDMLDTSDFSQFDAIITGIRAYNTRQRLINIQPRLLQYVKDGGTLIVQYNVSRGLLTTNIGPYPFTIGRDRVSMESASVHFLKPDHQLLNYPNQITSKDFENWIQERGLYFASEWDPQYEPILSAHDVNESNKNGGLIFARYGQGVFIYTGYSWFRQLPAGVPGAYRLFANLISAGKYDAKSNN